MKGINSATSFALPRITTPDRPLSPSSLPRNSVLSCRGARSPRVRSWLIREVPTTSAPRPVYLQQPTFWPRLGMSQVGESPGGISPPGAPRTVREPLDSHGSRCSAIGTHLQWLCLIHRAPPVASWPWASAEQRSPFGPVPLQNLHPYYGLLRPCAPHRYSGPRGLSRL